MVKDYGIAYIVRLAKSTSLSRDTEVEPHRRMQFSTTLRIPFLESGITPLHEIQSAYAKPRRQINQIRFVNLSFFMGKIYGTKA